MKHLAAYVLVLVLATSATRAQDPVKLLLVQLDSPKSATRFDALMALADLGPQAAPATDRLILILKGFEEEERTWATIALGKIGKSAFTPLLKLLDHEDEAVRHNAVWALGLMGADAQAHTPRLLKLATHDPDEDVRVKAIFAVTRIAPARPETMATLAPLVTDEKTRLALRLVILEEMRNCGDPAIGVLGRALQDERTYDTAQQSLKHLLEKNKTKSAAEAMRPFVEIAYTQAIAHPLPPWARRAAVLSELCDGAGMRYVIATLGDQVLTPVEKRLRSKDAVERAAACVLLGKMAHTLRAHGDAPALVEGIATALLPLFHDPDPAPRRAVAENIPPTKASVAALRGTLLDDDYRVRHAAYLALGGRFVDMASARARFVKSTGVEQVRGACALASLEYDKDALAFLWKHLAQPKAEFRHHAAYTLGMLQSGSTTPSEETKKFVMPVLVESLGCNDEQKRLQAADALAISFWQIDGTLVPKLIAALKDKDARVRQHVIAALRTQARPTRNDILPAVLPFLRDPDPQTQIYAIHCFGNTGKQSVAELIKHLETEKIRDVRNRLMTALTQPDEPTAVEALFRMAANAEDRDHAIDALWRCGEKKTFPRTLEILRKQDAAVDQTFKEVKEPPALIVDAALALLPLFQRDDVAVNRRAVHTLGVLTKILWADTAIWMMPLQRAYEQRMKGMKPLIEAKDEARRREAVEFLGELRALQRSMYFHISSRTATKLRPEMDEIWHKNQQTIDELLGLARRDAQLSVRRAARKAMLTLTPLDPSR